MFYPHGPNAKEIISNNLHLLSNNRQLNILFLKESILVANRREKNLKNLLMAIDPYDIKSDVTGTFSATSQIGV